MQSAICLSILNRHIIWSRNINKQTVSFVRAIPFLGRVVPVRSARRIASSVTSTWTSFSAFSCNYATTYVPALAFFMMWCQKVYQNYKFRTFDGILKRPNYPMLRRAPFIFFIFLGNFCDIFPCLNFKQFLSLRTYLNFARSWISLYQLIAL